MSSIPGAFAISSCRCADSECEHREEIIPKLPTKKIERIMGQMYINKKGVKVIWNGKILHCEHNQQKSQCKECGGANICKHNRQKPHCKECGGGSICKHNRQKSQCKECGGASICKHNRRKSHCKECGGASICEHNRRKSTCKECGGASICEHNRRKSICKECGGSALCKTVYCEKKAMNKYEGHCMTCFINNPINANKPAHRNYRTKEKEVALAVTKRFPNATWILDKRVQDGCSARRPDILVDLGYQVIIVEVDENKHTDYDSNCEGKRLMSIWEDLNNRPMVIIRFNPDSYQNSHGVKVPSCWKLNKKGVVDIPKDRQENWNERIECLLENIQYWMDNKNEKEVEIVKLFYD